MTGIEGGSRDHLALGLKVGMFVLLALLGLIIFPRTLYPLAGYVIAAALGVFAAAATANAITLRIFERAPLAAIGLGWTRGSARNLGLGLLGGVAAALVVLGLPLVAGIAEFSPDPKNTGGAGSAFLIFVVLLFGVVGEEMLFRGYPFQLLMGTVGRFAIIFPAAVLFGAAHGSNANINALGIINTVGFGVVLGYAFARSGDLWLPIGIHLGWNWMLPLFGANLSGFTMGITGFTLRWKAGDLWSGGNYGPEASVLTCVVVVGLMFYLAKAPVAPQQAILLRPKQEDADA